MFVTPGYAQEAAPAEGEAHGDEAGHTEGHTEAGGIIEVRRDRIAQDLDQAARMKEEADAAVAAYEQELAEAKASANVIGQKARDQARGEADAERKRVEAELDGKLAKSEQHIAAIKAKALGEVDTIAEDAAAAIIRQLVGGTVDKAAIAAAVKATKG
jgi:F-type H+-transporting ATPase subunit b